MLTKNRLKTYSDIFITLLFFFVVGFLYGQRGQELIAYANDIKITNPEEAIRISENVLLRLDDREPINYEVYLVLIEASIYLEWYDKATDYIFKLKQYNYKLPVEIQFKTSLLEARIYHVLRFKSYEEDSLQEAYSLLESVDNDSLKKRLELEITLQNRRMQVIDSSSNDLSFELPIIPSNGIGETERFNILSYLDYLILESIKSIHSNAPYDFREKLNKISLEYAINYDKLYYENFSLIDAQYYSVKKDHATAIQILSNTMDYLTLSNTHLHYKSQVTEALINNFIEVKDKTELLGARKTSNGLESQTLEVETSIINRIFEYKSAQSKEELTYLINKQKRIINLIIIISIIVLFIAVLLWFRYHSQNKQYKEVQHYLAKLEDKSNIIEVKPKAKSKPSSKISDELEMQIIKGLEYFEQTDDYLNNNVSLAYLATKLDVNTKYLSGFLNSQLNESFSNYINRLRIEYIVGKLKNDPKYLKYKISYLAEDAGYSSHSSFTTAFKAVTGMAPTKFISYLKK